MVGLWSGLLTSSSWGGDPASDQIERARVLRELAESSAAAATEPRVVLPPAGLEIEQLKQEQDQAVVTDNNRRWRKLLGEQARVRNLPAEEPGARQIRSLLDGRTQDAQELHRRIQRQDLEYRLQRDR
ncbi:MAG: hypothetical protein ACREU7_14770 [Burkholderiales bacterium]